MSDYQQIKHLRTVRSYVQRAGRITPRQSMALTHYWETYGLELAHGLMDAETVFGRQAPLILEIGFGMGQSLLEMAKQNPDHDYLGIEVHRPGVGSLLASAWEASVNNLRIYCADALEVLNKCIKDDSLSAVLLFFPDPWPKKRHQKRRIVQPHFIRMIWKKLKANGYIHMATDVEEYAQYMIEMFTADSGFVQSKPNKRPVTKFEKRGEKLGNLIWDIVFSKIS